MMKWEGMEMHAKGIGFEETSGDARCSWVRSGGKRGAKLAAECVREGDETKSKSNVSGEVTRGLELHWATGVGFGVTVNSRTRRQGVEWCCLLQCERTCEQR